MDDNNNETTSEIDFIDQLKSGFTSEWDGNEPDINFFLLLIALLVFVVWIVFISFFFSRLLGIFVGYWFRRFLKWTGVNNIVELSIGSFSVISKIYIKK